MLKGVGIDIESTHRIGKLLEEHDFSTLQQIFTRNELEQSQRADSPALYLTACFSAKEAVGKALGTGMASIGWNDIEADVQESQIGVTLHGEALRLAIGMGASRWQAWWSSWSDHVAVVAVVQ